MFFQTLSYSSIKEILKEVNYSLAKRGTTGKIIITGGSAISILTRGERVTTDIDYVGNLNDPDLNYNSYDSLVNGLRSSHKIVVCERGIPLEKALKLARMYSKFKAYPHKHLNLGLLLATPIEQCLQVFGFKEYLQKITGYDFRI